MAAGKKLTQEEFIARAKEVHGDKYDYSKVAYKNSSVKVCIVCPEHGEFWQNPSQHLSGVGCPKCAGKGKTREDFIEKATVVHNGKYDYSKVVYKGVDKKVCIICPEHGEFWQQPNLHLKGCGCPKCSGNVKRTAEDFFLKAKEVHGDKYDLSKVNYVDNKTKVCIICPKHGEFMITPKNFLRGNGCRKCATELHAQKNRKDKQYFLERARNKHGNKYDYSKVKYIDASTKVCIICPEHGEFWQTPNDHYHSGCEICAREARAKKKVEKASNTFREKAVGVHGNKYDYSKVEYKSAKEKVCIICPEHGEFWQAPTTHLRCAVFPRCQGNFRLTKEEFIEKANEIHGGKYDYSKVEYKNIRTKICIICPEHGEFWQKPEHHLSAHGCPNCQGLTKEYKFNLLEEFIDEFHLREFLMTNDENMIYIILRNIEKIDPKYNPIVKDIDRAFRSNSNDPIKDLEDKYRKTDVEITNEAATNMHSSTSIQALDLDDDDAVDSYINNTTEGEKKNETKEPTIEDLTKARESEIKMINKIEHMLTPEDRQFIKDKFLNDKRRAWISQREKIGK